MAIPSLSISNLDFYNALLGNQVCNLNITPSTFPSYVKYNWWEKSNFNSDTFTGVGLGEGVLANIKTAPLVEYGGQYLPLSGNGFTIGRRVDNRVFVNITTGAFQFSSPSEEVDWVSISPLVFIASQQVPVAKFTLAGLTDPDNNVYLGFILTPCKLSEQYKGYGTFDCTFNFNEVNFPYLTADGDRDYVDNLYWQYYSFPLSYNSVSDKDYLIASVRLDALSTFSTGSDGSGEVPTHKVSFPNYDPSIYQPLLGNVQMSAQNSGNPYQEGYQEGVNQSLTGESGAWDLFESAFTTAGNVFSVELFPNFTLGTLLLIPLMATIVVWILHLIKK